MATTTNYSWTTPDDTDLVKDGAAAIRTLGSSIDTSVKALSPGTTAGDIDYYTTSTAKARVGLGTANQVLRVNSGATAPEWATVSGGDFIKISTGTFSANTGVAFDSVFSSTYDNYRIVLNFTATSGSPNSINIRYRTGGSNNTTSNYASGWRNWIVNNGSQSGGGSANSSNAFSVMNSNDSHGSISFDIYNPFSTNITYATWSAVTGQYSYVGTGRFNDTTSFDGIFIYVDTGNYTGEATVYGYTK
jgi:hypothetical protein